MRVSCWFLPEFPMKQWGGNTEQPNKQRHANNLNFTPRVAQQLKFDANVTDRQLKKVALRYDTNYLLCFVIT